MTDKELKKEEEMREAVSRCTFSSIEEVREAINSLTLKPNALQNMRARELASQRRQTELEYEPQIGHLVSVSRAVLSLHPSIEIITKEEEQPKPEPQVEVYDSEPEQPKEKTFDILEGLTDDQKEVIKFLVEKQGYNPMGFDVLVEENRIFYFGKEVKGRK